MENENQKKQPIIQVESSGATAIAGGVAAGAGGYAAGRDIIIYHPITNDQLKIPTIESTLKKERNFEGDFFYEEPRWVDFKKRFIIERKEVDEIIKKMEINKTQMILGIAASGKSVILKNVGFKITDENRRVYIIELKKHSRDEIKAFFDYIPKINDEKAVFIIDDAHLYISDCERLVQDFEERGKGHLIVGSRDVKKIIEGHPKESSEFKNLSKTCIRVQAEDITEKMIQMFLKGKYNFSDERINIVSTNLEKYKEDLWFLSWALKAYNPKADSVKEEEIYKNIKDSIRTIDAGDDTINAEDVFLPLSVFYRFEIPIEQDFLENRLDIDGDIINYLIETSEIIETEEIGKNRMLSLNHSSIAQLYLKTYQIYPDFGKRIKKNINKNIVEKDYEVTLFRNYLEYQPENYDEMFLRLSYEEELIYKIFKDSTIYQTINNLLNEEHDIKKIGRCLSGISEASTKVATRLIEGLNLENLISKIEKESDIEKITTCISGISEANPEVLNSLIEELDFYNIESKILEESNIGNIGTFIFEIFSGNYEVGITLLSDRVLKSLRTKMELEPNIEKIGRFINDISYVDNLFAEEFVDIVKSKIETESDIEKIGSCVSEISSANKDFGVELINIVKSKLEKETEIEKVLSCIIETSRASVKIGLKFVDIILSKLEKEQDIEKIGNSLSEIPVVNSEIWTALVQKLDLNNIILKIEKESNIEKIGRCVSEISRASSEIGLKLVETVEDKIENESDIEKISYCINYIYYGSIKVWRALVQELDLDCLISKIENEFDIKKIENLVSEISKADGEVGLKLVNIVRLKLEKEQNFENIVLCVSNILFENSNVGMELVDTFKSKLEREPDFEKIRICSSYFSEASSDGKIFLQIIENELRQRGIINL